MAAAVPQLAGFALLLEHPQYLVVDKPAGLLSQPGLGSHQRDSLITRLQHDCPELRLVHRLDRETSGLVLVAKNQGSLRSLSALFAARRVHKLYLADVVRPLLGRRGSIHLPLARLQRQPPVYGPHPQGKPCCTLWRKWTQSTDCTRLWLRPLTGRSHQLRAHLAAVGAPIRADRIYTDSDLQGPMHLHAYALSFQDPDDQRRVRVRSALPNWAQAEWAQAEKLRFAGMG
ncbi:MAG: RluA family pseudouridine synthase [Synechococcus sp. MIT S9220]|nr:RluA family pseudouridine synthase [Synechococcus sp. MIT S9220]NOL47348.1 RluA family pseudouridine synthase [Synechococcus sp. MIT S9220]